MVSLLCAMTMSSWAQTTLIDYPTGTTGIIPCGSTLATTVKIHMNTDAVPCYQLKNGYNSGGESNGNHIQLSVEGGFKAGDVLTIAGAVNNDDTSKWGTAVLFTMDASLNVSVIYDGFSNFINSRLVNDDPVEESYTLTEDYDVLYLGRNGNTGANVTLIKVVRPSSADKEDVTMSFPEESYSVMEGTTFEAPELTISPEVSPITFASSNEDVATVDESTGAVTVVAQGTTTITASFAGDDTYNAATASYTLNVTRFINGTLLIDYPNTNDGITISGTTVEETVKIHSNTDAIKGIGLKNGYSNGTAMNGNHIKLEVEGGFKKGDVLTIAGAYNNSSEKDARVALFTSEDGETAIVIKDDFEPFINGRLVDDEPVEQTYTLENDYDVLYLGRIGNTGTYVTLITMVRPNSEEPETVDVTISASTYATYYNSSMAMRAPADVSVNLATMGENSVTLISIGQIIPKGCPVVLHANEGTYTLQHEALADNMENTRPNDLIGTVEAGTFGNDGAKYYVLSWKDKNKNVDEVGFYWLQGSGGAYAKVKAHQAYMRIDEGAAPSGVNGFSFTFDEATGITTIDSDSSLDVSAPMYNLAGQRVSKDYKGVVIQDGKKTIKK